MAFAAKGPGCVLMGLVAHAPFLGRDLARLALRFWAERMGRAGGGFVGLVAYLFWPGAWLGLLCAFGANALAWSAAGSMGGVAGFAKDIFPLPGNKKTARRIQLTKNFLPVPVSWRTVIIYNAYTWIFKTVLYIRSGAENPRRSMLVSSTLLVSWSS